MSRLYEFTEFYLNKVLPETPSYKKHFNEENFDRNIAILIEKFQESYGFNPFDENISISDLDNKKANNNVFKEYDKSIGNRIPHAIINKHYRRFLNKYTTLKTNTMNTENEMQKYTDLLKHKPQIILQGPPGTGKTREAKRIAKALLGLGENDTLNNNEQFKLIQFHPSYSYEDFVRGIVAEPNEEGDGIVYTAENKILGEFAKNALNNWHKSHLSTPVLEEEEVFEAFIEHIKEELAQSEDYKYPLTEAIYIFDADDKRFKYKGDNWEVHNKGINMNYAEIKRIKKYRWSS